MITDLLWLVFLLFSVAGLIATLSWVVLAPAYVVWWWGRRAMRQRATWLRQDGFTLPELVFVIILVFLLLGWSIWRYA